MIRKIFRLRESEFIKNALTVISGSSIAQIIPIIAAPFLSRIYSPSNYGVLGIYVGLSGLIGIIATFQYHNAILIPKQKEEAVFLLQLCIRNTIIASILSLLAVVFFGGIVLELINAPNVQRWLPLLPVSVLCMGFNSTFSAYLNRVKLFGVLSMNRIYGSIASVVVSFSSAYFFQDERGLIYGLIAGQLVNGIILGIRLLNVSDIQVGGLLFKQSLKEVRKKYNNFPKYSLPADLLNNFTNQFPVLIINAFSGQGATGLFNMCNRLLSMPQIFLANSLGEVFRQRAAQDFNHKGSFRSIFLKTAKTLLIVSILPFLLLLLWGPDLFAFFLGEKWREAGMFARIMAPLFLLRFVNSPLSYSLYIVGKLKFDLAMTIYLNLSTIVILYIAINKFPLTTAISFYVINYCITYLFMLYKSYQFSKTLNPSYGSI